MPAQGEAIRKCGGGS